MAPPLIKASVLGDVDEVVAIISGGTSDLFVRDDVRAIIRDRLPPTRQETAMMVLPLEEEHERTNDENENGETMTRQTSSPKRWSRT